MAKLSVFEPSSIEQSHRRRHPTKNVFSKNDSIFLLIVNEKKFGALPVDPEPGILIFFSGEALVHQANAADCCQPHGWKLVKP